MGLLRKCNYLIYHFVIHLETNLGQPVTLN